MIKVKLLVWDTWNRGHIKKHRISEEEIEEVCSGTFRQQPTYGQRYLIFGGTSKRRLLTVVLAKEKSGVYYVVTARDTSKKERRRFIQ